ncbi:MAG: NADH-quinone oxidoreductase subunit C [Actinomycetes bacterium]
MTTHWVDAVTDAFGPFDGVVTVALDEVVVDVAARHWRDAARSARDVLGLRFFDWLSAVDELEGSYDVLMHLYSPDSRQRLLIRTRVGGATGNLPVLASITDVFAGASWHERETCEMFGIDFAGHPNLVPLLLPDGFQGHPLRKSFVLAARAAKPWPGAKDPGESEHAAAPSRRKTLPPGVPDPAQWGPRSPEGQP